ncbi:MAG: alpha-ketoacid dehydrogenase subunit beta [Planctomycetota bacterium]
MPKLYYIEAITQALQEEMARDSSVFCIGEDIAEYGGAFKVTKGLVERFGVDRVIDSPLDEAAIIGVSIGAAIMGMRPVAEMQFADFVACGFNQLVNNAAKIYYRWGHPVPMVVRCPSGGGLSAGPYHSQNPEAWFIHTPGLKVVAPYSAYDAKGLLKAAIRDPNPVVFLEHKYLYRRMKEEVPEEEYIVPLGKAKIQRLGKDLSVITYGSMVVFALEAAEKLQKETGYQAEIVDLRTLVPLDEELVLASVKKTSKALLLHEASLNCGFGAEVAARIAEKVFTFLDGPVKRLASKDTPVPFSPALEENFMPTVDKIYQSMLDLARF